MKCRIIYLFALLLIVGQSSCKKYLDVKPLDHLAGNSYFQNRQDVESNLWDIYGLFRDEIGSCPLLPFSGDLRSGMMGASPYYANQRYYRTYVPQNKLVELIVDDPDAYINAHYFHYINFTKWKGFYKVIQAANDLYFELNRRPIKGLSKDDIKRYQGEAVFMRCLAYFFMIRLWGDVPYYTDAYHEAPLPRENMVVVANNCLADLAKVKDNMPWTFTEPAYLGVRASRGAVLALMMNLDMWNAGFDKKNARKYWQQCATLGDELVKSHAYELLPLKDFHKIFKGRTKESLFEIANNSNYGEIIYNVTFPDMVMHYPYRGSFSSFPYSYCYYRSSFLDILYPIGQPDLRIKYWFDEGMRSDDGNFQYLKFTNRYALGTSAANPDNDILIFRYAGLLLLRAEALAKLGGAANVQEAIRMLNLVRARAQATLYTGAGGQPLIDAVFIERAKELMGEGHYYYDLIRTGRVMDQKWDYYPLTQSQFDNGGWTWPLNSSIEDNNPYVHVNSYWVK